jgi:chromosomal replication initiation ATPase DnaA
VQISSYHAYSLAIIGKAADLFGVEPSKITTPCKKPEYAWPRMAAAWALRMADPNSRKKGPNHRVFSLHRVASVVGWTDHTTVINAERRVPERRLSDSDFRCLTDELLEFALDHWPRHTFLRVG